MSLFSTSKVQQAVEQRQIGAWLDLQEEVGAFGGGGASGVDDDQLGAGLQPVGHPQVKDRMAVGHVRPGDEEQVGAVEVGVGARWAVGAERLLETGSRACHAQPRVRLDMHRSQEALGQLGGQILRLDGHLARYVECDGIRSVLVDDGAQPSSRLSDGVIDGYRHRLVTPGGTQKRGCQPSVDGGHHLGMRRTLGAQPPEVGGVQLVSGDPRDDGPAGIGVRCGVDLDTAADSAVGARRPGRHGRQAGTGAGLRPTCSPAPTRAVWTRRKTTQVTTAQIT